MSSYSWQLPAPPVVAPPAASASTATTRSSSLLGGLLDQEIDPLSHDFIDTDDGAWSETADSRSIVLCMLDIELGASVTSPKDGTRIAERIRRGDPVTSGFVVSELARAMQLLVNDGVVANVEINATDDKGRQLVDESGRPVFELRYDDLATGSPVDLAYAPAWG